MANFRDIIFNGRSMNSFGFFLKKDISIIDFPETGLESVEIEGAVNGGVLGGNEEFKEVEKTYTFKTIPSKIPYPEEKFIKVFTDWLQSNRDGYKELQDTAKKGYFRKAWLKNVSDFKKSYSGCYEISLTFSFKPIWFSFGGQKPIKKTITGAGLTPIEIELTNPEKFKAYPIIKISASDTTVTNGAAILVDDQQTALRINHFDGDVVINSETKKIDFPLWVNVNNQQTLSGYGLPYFKAGENTLIFVGTNGITYDLEIIPQWGCR